MSVDEPMPASYPSVGEQPPRRHRAAFSRNFAGLSTHHAVASSLPPGEEARRRRTHQDDSLRLIEDLTNRPVDPMFSDARLTHGAPGAVSIWGTRIIVFLLCIVVGIAGSVVVRQLHTDPRRPVRVSLAAQLDDASDEVNSLNREVDALQSEITRHTNAAAPGDATRTLAQDNAVIGLTAVHGEGLTVTIANPLSAANDAAATSQTASDKLRVVTDTDLQQIVSVLWEAGAEAIAVNGHRLGAQTAIREAGGLILVGLKSIDSPYTIQAIGERSALAHALDRSTQPALYEAFSKAGISIQTRTTKDMTLNAAVSGELQYAKEK